MKYKGVLFDLDNTLIVRRPTSIEVLYSLCKRAGKPRTKEEVTRAYSNGENWIGEQTLEENKTGRRISDEAFLENLITVYEKNLQLCFLEEDKELIPVRNKAAKKTEVMEGAIKVLNELKKQGYLLGVVSNNIKEIRGPLKKLGLIDFFNTIVISEEVNLHKPDKRILLLGANRLGLTPRECIYIGDHPFDILCAHEGGMDIAFCPISRLIRVPKGIGKPEYWLEAIEDILNILEISM